MAGHFKVNEKSLVSERELQRAAIVAVVRALHAHSIALLLGPQVEQLRATHATINLLSDNSV